MLGCSGAAGKELGQSEGEHPLARFLEHKKIDWESFEVKPCALSADLSDLVGNIGDLVGNIVSVNLVDSQSDA